MSDVPQNSDIQHLIRKYKLPPKHSFGQNFLIDEEVYEKIMSAADINDDCVIEIGTGFGTLTKRLAQHARFVISVEADVDIYNAMKLELRDVKNISLVRGNALLFSIENLLTHAPADCTRVKIVANIPYNITGKLLRQFIPDTHVSKAVLLVQKEVAERITALPGGMSMLSLTAQWFSSIRMLAQVPRTSFFPEPNVDSAIISLTPTDKWEKQLSKDESAEDIFRLARMAFNQRRKKITNSLSAGLHLTSTEVEAVLKRAKLNVSMRPQELSIEDWIRLSKTVFPIRQS